MLEHLVDKDVYIYGCGSGCVIVSAFLDEVYGVVPKCAVISDGRRHSDTMTTPLGHTFPVMELSTFKRTAKVDARSYMLNTVTTDTDAISAAISDCGFTDQQHESIGRSMCCDLFCELLRLYRVIDDNASWCIYGRSDLYFSCRDAASGIFAYTQYTIPTHNSHTDTSCLRCLVVPDGHLCERETQLLAPDGASVGIVELSDFLESPDVSVFVDMLSSSGDDEVKRLLEEHGFAGRYIDLSSMRSMLASFSMLKFTQYFRDRLSSMGIDVEDEVLHFKDVAFFNPGSRKQDGSCNETAQGIVSFTLFDDIMPQVYGDLALTHEGPYEVGEVRCEKGDVVVDVGANFGTFTCWAASCGCDVYAFEPDETNIAVLKKQQELYPGRITIVPKALSDKSETISFFLDDISSGSTMFPGAYGTIETKVEAVSIDDLVRDGVLPRVDFIKADIEGAERLMLEGARETIAKFKPKISVCIYHRPDDREVLTRIIKEACPEYEVEYRWKKLYAHVPK